MSLSPISPDSDPSTMHLNIPGISGIQPSRLLQKNSPLGGSSSGSSKLPYMTYVKSPALSYIHATQSVVSRSHHTMIFSTYPELQNPRPTGPTELTMEKHARPVICAVDGGRSSGDCESFLGDLDCDAEGRAEEFLDIVSHVVRMEGYLPCSSCSGRGMSGRRLVRRGRWSI